MVKRVLKRIHSDYLYYHFKRLYEKNPRLAAEGLYKKVYGRKRALSLDPPKNLIEKIVWLELNTDTSLWTLCADKYRMREYVAQCGLQEYLPKLYGHWDNPEDIDFSVLPNEFVLKANNGCGTVLIVRDKSLLDERKVKKELKRWLKHKFGYWGAQTHYLSIEPCILAEELLHQEEDEKNGKNRSLTDYKVWCFSGVPECILVIHDRVRKEYLMDMYDVKWERIPNSLKKNTHYGVTDVTIPKPACLDQMLEMASKLSRQFVEVRVDFYVIENKPIIGELTFTTGYGNYTDEFYDYLGGKVDLSKVK